MPAILLTLTEKDRDLLRLALTVASEDIPGDQLSAELRARLKDLKERLF